MNKDYIVISSGLFKDHKEEEFILMNETSSDIRTHTYTSLTAEDIRDTIYTVFNETPLRRSQPVIHASAEGHRQFHEAIQRVVQDPVIFGTAGESQLENEQIWNDLRTESIPIEERDSIITVRNMTEQELINYFDTISNEQQ